MEHVAPGFRNDYETAHVPPSVVQALQGNHYGAKVSMSQCWPLTYAEHLGTETSKEVGMVSRYDRRPAFGQVADALRQRIISGDLAPGDQLPSFSQIQEQYGVAVTTAQRAIRALKEEGLIEGHPGKGNFVRQERKIVTLSASYVKPDEGGKWTSWRAAAREQGMEGTQTIDEVADVEPPHQVADALRLPDGGRAIVRRRTMYLDGKPVQLADTYFPPEIAEGTPLARPEKVRGGVAALLDEMGYRTAECDEFVSARMPLGREVRSLDLKEGVPVIELFRVTKAAADAPVQCEVFVLAADRHRLRYSLPGC